MCPASRVYIYMRAGKQKMIMLEIGIGEGAQKTGTDNFYLAILLLLFFYLF